MARDGDGGGDGLMWSGLLHGGLSGSFMRLPVLPPGREELAAAGARAAVYGIPWDSTSISRTGANYGPRGMREVSCQFIGYNAGLDFNLVEALAPVDCGDAPVVLANAEKTFAAARRDIGEILAAGALPVTLGGDHSVSIPALRAVRDHCRRPGLVLVDSHLDTAADVGGELLNHCCPISRAVDAGFPPENIVLVGINGWLNPPAELDYAREHGIEVIWLEDLWAEGPGRVAERALEIAGEGSDGVYLSFDVDALDAAYAPGTCVPTPGGLTAREAIELVRGISAGGLLGLDVVEVAPSLDPTSATAALGCRLALEAMAFHAGAALPGRGLGGIAAEAGGGGAPGR
jgi:agmatinase